MRGEQDESTDTSKPLDLDATVSVVEPTRRADRTSITVPSKEDEDEVNESMRCPSRLTTRFQVSAMEVDDDNVEQGNAADETGPVSRNHQQPTAMATSSDAFNAMATAAASRKSTAYPAFSQARAQNTQVRSLRCLHSDAGFSSLSSSRRRLRCASRWLSAVRGAPSSLTDSSSSLRIRHRRVVRARRTRFHCAARSDRVTSCHSGYVHFWKEL